MNKLFKVRVDYPQQCVEFVVESDVECKQVTARLPGYPLTKVWGYNRTNHGLVEAESWMVINWDKVLYYDVIEIERP